MNDVEKKGEELTVWGAVGPNGHVVKSSIGIFKAVANRWALKRGNYEVIKLGTIIAPPVDDTKPAEEAKPQQKRINREVRGPQPRKRRTRRDEQQRAG